MAQQEKEFTVAVYCSASEGLPEQWMAAAREIGLWIGRSGSTLVYGGVDAGLMRVVAEAVKSCGAGRITGVVPELRSNMASPLNDVSIAVSGLSERKSAMCGMSDVFVVLPGGYGTLDEFFTTLACLRFNGVDSKTIVLYNPDGLYDSLLNQFDTLMRSGLMNSHSLDYVKVVNGTHGLTGCLDNLKTNRHDKK